MRLQQLLPKFRLLRCGTEWLALCLLSYGCATAPAGLERVAAGLEARSGHALPKPGEKSVPPSISFEDGLSEDEAVALALWNNAAFQETLAELGLSRADVVQAGMLPNPTFSMLFPAGAKPLELTVKYPLEILWLRPRRLAVARLDYNRVAERLIQTGLDFIRDVKLACIDLWLAQERGQRAQESLDLAEQIRKLSQSRLSAGELSELEAGTAAIEALQAEEQLTRFRHEANIAHERVAYLIGIERGEWKLSAPASRVAELLEDNPAAVVKKALGARPDLRAAELGLEGAGARIGLARAEVLAFVAGINAKESGQDFLAGPTLDMPIPLFNQNQGGIALAKAAFEKASRHYASVRDRIVMEVREAHARVRQAQASLGLWQKQILPPIAATVSQAEKAYAAGEVSLLLMLEASRKLAEARSRESSAAAEVRRSWAELERSAGGGLVMDPNHAQITGAHTH